MYHWLISQHHSAHILAMRNSTRAPLVSSTAQQCFHRTDAAHQCHQIKHEHSRAPCLKWHYQHALWEPELQIPLHSLGIIFEKSLPNCFSINPVTFHREFSLSLHTCVPALAASTFFFPPRLDKRERICMCQCVRTPARN